MNIFQSAILHALNVRERAHRGHMYEGTVPDAEKAKRRAKDKAARAARRVQRRNAK